MMLCDALINCNLIGLTGLISELTLQEILGRQVERGFAGLIDNSSDIISESTRSRLNGWIKEIGIQVATDFEMIAAKERLARFEEIIRTPQTTNRDVFYQIKALREAIDDGIKNQLLYRYPKNKAEILKRWNTDWASAIKAFPSAKDDILAGIDIWALGHYTASVFHMMRVLEHGLSALAHNVDRKFDNQNWQNIIDEIESAIRQQQKSLPRGTERQNRLHFLSEVAKEFIYFKDGWRNHVSHNKCTYEENQSRIVMDHTCQFMTLISSHLAHGDLEKSR